MRAKIKRDVVERALDALSALTTELSEGLGEKGFISTRYVLEKEIDLVTWLGLITAESISEDVEPKPKNPGQNTTRFVRFESWETLLDWLSEYRTVDYLGAMDYRPRRVSAYLDHEGDVMLKPTPGNEGAFDPFHAMEKDLSCFWRAV